MKLVEGKEKLFSLFLAESGNGKTMLMYLLMKAAHKPTLIIDSCHQISGAHKTLAQLQDYFSDRDNLEDYLTYNRQILIDLKEGQAADFYAWLMASKYLAGSLIVNDEIDIVLGTSKITEKHPYYIFCNRGRHYEFDHMITARATQNIPKCLTQQADVYYIGMAQNKYMIEYIEANIALKGLKELAENIEQYRYIKVSKKGKGLMQTVKLDPKLTQLFT